MQWKLLSVSLILLSQVFGRLMAQTSGPPVEDAPGLLNGLAEKAREATAKVQQAGGVVLDFADFYYQENVKPVSDSYWEWASATTNSMWERVKKTVDRFRPLPTSQSG